jgi:AbrB family looped-hinge helix DNA binding protein
MKSTIDKAGRVVIPAAIRARAGLEPGTELEIRFEDGEVRIVRNVARPRLVRVGGRWIARPGVPASKRPAVDLAAIVEEERDRWPS